MISGRKRLTIEVTKYQKDATLEAFSEGHPFIMSL